MSKPKPDPKSATKTTFPRTTQPPPSTNSPTPDEQLDEALEETFPASDPIAIDAPDTRDDPPRPVTSPASMHAARHAKPDTKSHKAHKEAQGKQPEPASASKSTSKHDQPSTDKHKSKHH